MRFSLSNAAGRALGVWLACQALTLASSTAPAVDKTKIANYLRYAEGWIDGVEVTVADPKPSPIPGFSELDIDLAYQKIKIQRVYYVSADGKSIVSGNLYNLNDSPFRTTLDKLQIKDAPSKGPANAAVTIVMFGDLQCPYCRTDAKLLDNEVLKKYPQQVRVVYKDFPLDGHDWARKAAIGAHCVEQQDAGAFWAYEDYMYSRQGDITADNLDAAILAFAKQQPNLDAMGLTTCVQNQATAPIVEESLRQGRSLGIDKTPALFVNGRMMLGEMPLETLDMVIQIELKRKAEGAKVSSSAEKCCEVSVPRIAKQ
jgi:protein-disulfide isomerase